MATAEKTQSDLWNPQRRSFTAGLVLVITLVAFEAMGLGAALPTIVAELGAQHWYSWPFTVFLGASAIGTVLGGRQADRRGPALPLLLALPTFAVGLIVAAAAHSILVLLVARVLQGFGGGALIVALYVMIGRVFPEKHRPAAFAAMSSAWVVPALVGPVIAGFLTEHVSWRWVFFGLAPLVCIGTAMLVPTVRRFGASSGEPPAQRRGLPLAAAGAAGGVLVLNFAVQNPSLSSLFLGLAGIVVLAPSIRLLLPKGTLLARPGLPAMVLARGLLAGLFFTAQAFVPLTLSAVHHYSPTTAGMPLTAGSLGWTVGALWQSRQRNIRREYLVAAGFLLVGVGMAGLALCLSQWGPHWLVFAFWFFAGSGMGIGGASTSVRVLALSAEGERGFNSSALQISDMLGQASLVGLGGVAVAALATGTAPTRGVVPLDLALLVGAVLAALLLVRSGRGQTS